MCALTVAIVTAGGGASPLPSPSSSHVSGLLPPLPTDGALVKYIDSPPKIPSVPAEASLSLDFGDVTRAEATLQPVPKALDVAAVDGGGGSSRDADQPSGSGVVV